MFPSVLHMLVVVILVLLVFGAGRVPGIMENLARGINAFKRGLGDENKPSKKDDQMNG